jgi:hypothetical protein
VRCRGGRDEFCADPFDRDTHTSRDLRGREFELVDGDADDSAACLAFRKHKRGRVVAVQAEDIEIAGVRISLQLLLDPKRQATVQSAFCRKVPSVRLQCVHGNRAHDFTLENRGTSKIDNGLASSPRRPSGKAECQSGGVFLNDVAGNEAERGSHPREIGLPSAENERTEIEVVLVDHTDVGEARR